MCVREGTILDGGEEEEEFIPLGGILIVNQG